MIMKLVLIFVVATLTVGGGISANLRHKTIVIEYHDIDRRFTKSRHVSPAATSTRQGKDPIKFSDRTEPVEFRQKLCDKVLRADIYRLTDNDPVFALQFPYPFNPTENVFSHDVPATVAKIPYHYEGEDHEIEVMVCAQNEKKIVYVENASNDRDFYIFEKRVGPGTLPLLRRVMTAALAVWNIQTREIDMEMSTSGYISHDAIVKEKFFFVAEYFAEEAERISICEVVGYERYEMCARLVPVWYHDDRVTHGKYVQIRETGFTCIDQKVRFHHEPKEYRLLRGPYYPLKVVPCYVDRKIADGPSFYVAADQEVENGAFILEKSPVATYLMVIARVKNVLYM